MKQIGWYAKYTPYEPNLNDLKKFLPDLEPHIDRFPNIQSLFTLGYDTH
jgi:hypothetical protein